MSAEEHANLVRLRDEREATRQGMQICSKVHDQLEHSISTIDKYATGDTVQVLVSTKEKTIHGTNRGLGWRTMQVGGHLGDESLQQIARMFGGVNIPSLAHEGLSPKDNEQTVTGDDTGGKPESRFNAQYGGSFKLPT